MSVDAMQMHDMFEGVWTYDMPKIILHFIDLKYFLLYVQTLNERKTYIDYNELECNLL